MTCFNVQAYGATGDGSTDATMAFSNAIIALTQNGGGTLYVPFGTYAVTNTFTLTVPFCVKGEGKGGDDYNTPFNTNMQKAVSTIVINSATKPLFIVTNVMNGSFEKLALQNTNAAPTANAIVTIVCTNDTPQISFNTVSFQGGWTQIDFQEGEVWMVFNCNFIDPYYYALRVRNLVAADTGDWTILGNTFIARNHAAAVAIELEGSGGGKIIGNKINDTFTNGIFIRPTSNTSGLNIIGNNIENCLTCGIQAGSTNGSTWYSCAIVGNHFEFGGYGVALEGDGNGQNGVCSYSTVSDNVFLYTVNPIFLATSIGIHVSGNSSDVTPIVSMNPGNGGNSLMSIAPDQFGFLYPTNATVPNGYTLRATNGSALYWGQ